MLGIDVRTLENGMTVIFAPIRNNGSATANLTYEVGSANESLSHAELGLFHFLEHILFVGSKHYKGDNNITELEITSAAILNATTSVYRTNFFETVPLSDLEACIAREADRMIALDEALVANRMPNEAQVVINELEIGENDPSRRIWSELNYHAFKLQQNRHNTIGLRKFIAEATPAQLLAFRRKFYVPVNATYVFAGAFSKERADAIFDGVKQKFGDIPPGKANFGYTEEPEQHGMQRFVLSGPAPILAIGLKSPPGLTREAVALEVVAIMLNKRFEVLVQHGDAMQLSVMFERARQSTLFCIFGVGANENAIWDILDSARWTQEELETARAEILDKWERELDSSQGICSAVNEAVARGNYNDVNTRVVTVKSLTLADMANAMKFLAPHRATVGIMVPAKPPPPIPLTLIHSEPPPAQWTSPVEPDPYDTGSGIYYVRGSRTYVNVEFRLDAPCELLAHVLNAYETNPNTQWSASPRRLVLSYAGKTPPRIEFDRVRLARALQIGTGMYMGEEDNVDKRAMYELRKQLFGETDWDINVDSILALPFRGRVVACAPSPDLFQPLRQFEGAYEEYVPQGGNAKDVVVPLNKSSVKVLIGCATGIGRQDKAFLPLSIAVSTLGYGFHGLLMKEVRIKQGLTYGVYARLEPGLFYVSVSFAPANVEKGIRVVKEVLARWRDALTEREVEMQKQRLRLTPTVLSDDPGMLTRAHHTFFKNVDTTRAEVLDALKYIKDLVTVIVG